MRMKLAKNKLNNLKKRRSAIKLQCLFRKFKAIEMKKFLKRKKCAIKIQSICRKYFARKLFNTKKIFKEKTILLQIFWKKYFKKLNKKALILQRNYKMHKVIFKII